MHVFHVVSVWFGYAGMTAGVLIACIKTFWPDPRDRR
jgi:hypothetical protein